jgi:hypothetical protein
MIQKTFYTLCCVLMSLFLGFAPGAWASDPAPAKPAAKGKEPPKTVERPTRTFGEEPMFYFDAERKPFTDPFHKTELEDYYLCRGILGQWYRELLVDEINTLLEPLGLDKVDGTTCAVRLIKTKLGKKRPIVAVDLYPNSETMRSCVLGEKCSHMRSAVMYVSKDKTLYRSYIITDGAKHVNKNYCLTNKGETLAEQSCWRYFN